MEPRLNVQIKQHQQLSQEKIQSLQLLQMTSVELQAEIDLMLDDNPLLEREESPSAIDEISGVQNSNKDVQDGSEEENSSEPESPLEAMYDVWHVSSGEASPIEEIAVETNFREDLHDDLRFLPYSLRDSFFIVCLIEELDDRGFLTATLSDIARDYERIAKESGVHDASPVDWQLALQRLQSMDPPGVGAANPVEAMILQAERLNRSGRISDQTLSVIKNILRKDLLELARHNRKALIKDAHQKTALLDRALDVLSRLNPYPICKTSHTPQYVQPDIVVVQCNGQFVAKLPSGIYQSVRLKNKDEARKISTDVGHTLASRYSGEARSFMRGLRARQDTLQKIGDALVREQASFFTDGPAALKPWKIGDLAKELGINDSTVSRAVDGKFVLCKTGMCELRSFFSTAGVKSGDPTQLSEEMGPAQIGALITELIADEDPTKPLTDDALCTKLQAKHIEIARRTVAKYRELVGIPSARVRKRH